MAELKEARVPDIGGYDDVPVIEVLVAVGDTVAKDQGLVTLESDKATMEVPAPFAGVVKELKVKIGDTLSEGSVVAMIEAADDAPPLPRRQARTRGPSRRAVASTNRYRRSNRSRRAAKPDNIAQALASPPARSRRRPKPRRWAPALPPVRFDADALLPGKVPYASPAVRLFARELGVDLTQVKGSARGGRIAKQDVQNYVKDALQPAAARTVAAGGGGGGLNLLPWPKVDFAKFGEIEVKPLSRIKKISGANLARNWAMIPHVTQHDDADITELEELRVALNKENEKAGIKLTMLAFIMKACVAGAAEISRTSMPRWTPAART